MSKASVIASTDVVLTVPLIFATLPARSVALRAMALPAAYVLPPVKFIVITPSLSESVSLYVSPSITYSALKPFSLVNVTDAALSSTS